MLVAINQRLSAPEVRYQLEDSGTCILICDSELLAPAEAAGHDMECPPLLLTIDGPEGLCNTLPVRTHLRPAAAPTD